MAALTVTHEAGGARAYTERAISQSDLSQDSCTILAKWTKTRNLYRTFPYPARQYHLDKRVANFLPHFHRSRAREPVDK